MTDKTNIKNVTLNDNQLEQVTGGGSFEKGSKNCTSSGDIPNFRVGQLVLIKYDKGHFKSNVDCECRVISVSTVKKGVIWKEFTYSVKITNAPIYELIGQVVDDVYESALDYCLDS